MLTLNVALVFLHTVDPDAGVKTGAPLPLLTYIGQGGLPKQEFGTLTIIGEGLTQAVLFELTQT